jgi:hypothetical protein
LKQPKRFPKTRNSEYPTEWTIRGSNPGTDKIFFLPRIVHDDSGGSQPPVQLAPAYFSGVNRPGREFDHTPPVTAEVKNEWSYTSPTTLHMTSQCGQEQLCLYFERSVQRRLQVTVPQPTGNVEAHRSSEKKMLNSHVDHPPVWRYNRCWGRGRLWIPVAAVYIDQTFKAQWLLYVSPGLSFTNSAFCTHSVFMCFVWIWVQTAIIYLYSIKWLIFITDI